MPYALVVPGHSRAGRITPRCRRLLDEAARLARAERPSVVVFTGRSRLPGPSEAEQMLAAWHGPADVDVVLEPTALTTAQNASRTLRLLAERDVGGATVVCARAHAPRVARLFGAVYERHGLRCRVHPVGVRRSPPALLRELAGALVVGRQRRAALAELADLPRG